MQLSLLPRRLCSSHPLSTAASVGTWLINACYKCYLHLVSMYTMYNLLRSCGMWFKSTLYCSTKPGSHFAWAFVIVLFSFESDLYKLKIASSCHGWEGNKRQIRRQNQMIRANIMSYYCFSLEYRYDQHYIQTTTHSCEKKIRFKTAKSW